MSLGPSGRAPRLTIGQAAAQAWRDTRGTLSALAGAVQIAFFICLLASVARRFLLPTDPSTVATATLLGEFILSIVQAFLLTPFLIAVHRFVILGKTGRYTLAPGEHRFQLFFLWSIALSLLAWAPPFLLWAVKGISISGALSLMLVGFVYITAAIIISLRLIILFPAIAVDAPGATWRNAMADTKGSAWRILFIGFVTALPLIGAALLLGLIALSLGMPTEVARSSIGWIAVTSVFDAAFGVVGFTLAVAVASRLYKELGNRVNQPV